MTKALIEKRNRAIEAAKAVLAAVETEGRAMNEEEQRSWDGFMAEADSLKATIERAERQQEEDRALEASRGRATQTTTLTVDPNDALRGWLLSGSNIRPTDAQLRAAQTFGMTGRTFTMAMRNDSLRSGEDVRSWENRAQSTLTGAAGGNLVAQDFQRELEVALLAFGGVRQGARVIRTATGADLPWPTSNDTGNMGRRLGENQEATQTDMEFGQVVFGAHKYSSDVVKVSVELAQDSAINLAAEIGRALGERIGRIQNVEFTANTGAGPQGIIQGATLGHTAGAALTYEDFVDLEHSVNSAYRSGARFMFSDSTLREIKKIRDADGALIWQPSMREGAPDTVLGYSYIINDDMPAIGTGNRSILFGALSKFIVRDVRDITLVRLDELFALNGQIGYLAFARSDARMVDAGTGPVKYLTHA
jgi:HK97 family phage major capsid protein